MPEFKARYEFKYIIDEKQADYIRDVAMCFTDRDEHGDGGIYDVTSLYFDDLPWTLAMQTVEGQRNRMKIRIRTYGFTDEDPVFLEDKSRVGDSICKSRALMSRDQVHALCVGNPPPEGGFKAMKESHQDDLERFRNILDLYDLRPRLWVGYQREAFGSPFGEGSRLTFDRYLRIQAPPDERPYEPDPNNWKRVPLDSPGTILEMKFNGAFPFWMQRVAHDLNLRRRACSKYVQGAEFLGDVPWNRIEKGSVWTVY